MAISLKEIKARLELETPKFFRAVLKFKVAFLAAVSGIYGLGYHQYLPEEWSKRLAIAGVAIYVIGSLIESYLPVVNYKELETKLKESESGKS